MDRLKKISDAVKGIFTTAAEYPEVGKMIIEHLIKLVKVVDNKVSSMLLNKEIGSAGLSLLYNSFSTIEELTTILITNEYMANYFAFECKGFEFLVER